MHLTFRSTLVDVCSFAFMNLWEREILESVLRTHVFRLRFIRGCLGAIGYANDENLIESHETHRRSNFSPGWVEAELDDWGDFAENAPQQKPKPPCSRFATKTERLEFPFIDFVQHYGNSNKQKLCLAYQHRERSVNTSCLRRLITIPLQDDSFHPLSWFIKPLQSRKENGVELHRIMLLRNLCGSQNIIIIIFSLNISHPEAILTCSEVTQWGISSELTTKTCTFSGNTILIVEL